MKRTRINIIAVASSYNYEKSKRVHKSMLKSKHNDFLELVSNGTIIIEKQPYARCFDTLVPLTQEDVLRLKGTVTIIYK